MKAVRSANGTDCCRPWPRSPSVPRNHLTLAVPPAIYSLIMFFTAAAFGWLVNRRREGAPEQQAVSTSG